MRSQLPLIYNFFPGKYKRFFHVCSKFYFHFFLLQYFLPSYELEDWSSYAWSVEPPDLDLFSLSGDSDFIQLREVPFGCLADPVAKLTLFATWRYSTSMPTLKKLSSLFLLPLSLLLFFYLVRPIILAPACVYFVTFFSSRAGSFLPCFMSKAVTLIYISLSFNRLFIFIILVSFAFVLNYFLAHF